MVHQRHIIWMCVEAWFSQIRSHLYAIAMLQLQCSKRECIMHACDSVFKSLIVLLEYIKKL